MKPSFIIFVETTSGEIIRAFTWTRDAQSGVAKGWSEAKNFGFTPVRVWAEKINQANS